MSKQKVKVEMDTQDGIVCTPMQIVRSCGSCTAYLLTLLVACALTVIAGGSFWMAQSLSRLADGTNRLELKLCCGGSNVSSPFCIQTPQCPTTHGVF